jgi:glycosyltransferase involved in cell wall biosynthesis
MIQTTNPVPKLSILLTNFNGEQYLRASIESILNQTFQDFELIIVDDGSTDDSWQLIQEYSHSSEKIIAVQNEQNLGTSPALNVALMNARGQLITRQDADDISLPDRLELQVKFLDANPDYSAVASPADLVDSKGEFVRTGFLVNASEIPDLMLDHMCLCGPTVMIRRSAFEKVGFFFGNDVSYSEDYDLCLRIGEVGSIGSLPEPHYLYRQHAASVSQLKRFKQLFNKALALERALYRRHGSNPGINLMANVIRDYLRAGVLGYLSSEIDGAKESISRALAIDPGALDRQQPIRDILIRYAPDNSSAEVAYVNGIFQTLLPKNPTMQKLYRDVYAASLIHAGFEELREQKTSLAEKYFLKAVKYDRSWLRNTGVLSVVTKSLLRKLV